MQTSQIQQKLKAKLSTWGFAEPYPRFRFEIRLGNDDSLKLVRDLLMPEIGVEMYTFLHRVQKLKSEALAELEAQVKAGESVQVAQGQPFNDLF